ncbi:uncharacterized protein DEA37_0003233 [Paragonimus westermani]|uniref:Uncharacterized protein n=1 Tax=Paragonimus westermani TaxID=34504 RepID=A0A5J4NR60_9TREM|nr:uncharacterized protein DEA37_0003233 [Paragonimus westermani]
MPVYLTLIRLFFTPSAKRLRNMEASFWYRTAFEETDPTIALGNRSTESIKKPLQLPRWERPTAASAFQPIAMTPQVSVGTSPPVETPDMSIPDNPASPSSPIIGMILSSSPTVRDLERNGSTSASNPTFDRSTQTINMPRGSSPSEAQINVWLRRRDHPIHDVLRFPRDFAASHPTPLLPNHLPNHSLLDSQDLPPPSSRATQFAILRQHVFPIGSSYSQKHHNLQRPDSARPHPGGNIAPSLISNR